MAKVPWVNPFIGDVLVQRGDVVVGDGDGVVVLPRAAAEQVVELSERRDEEETRIFQRLRNGETTLTIYSLPTPIR